jgi:lipoate-protein ligase B
VVTLPDVVVAVEHAHPVYTIGKRDTDAGLPRATDEQQFRDVPVVKIRRGGGLTWHGPGQLTVYPIINVMDRYRATRTPAEKKGPSPIRWYTDVLERSTIATVRYFGVPAVPGMVGVWVPRLFGPGRELPAASDRKVGSIGLQLSDWVSMHGVGINVSNDLSFFDHIVMCELPDKRATSIALEISDGNYSVDILRKAGVASTTSDVELLARMVSERHTKGIRLDNVLEVWMSSFVEALNDVNSCAHPWDITAIGSNVTDDELAEYFIQSLSSRPPA